MFEIAAQRRGRRQKRGGRKRNPRKLSEPSSMPLVLTTTEMPAPGKPVSMVTAQRSSCSGTSGGGGGGGIGSGSNGEQAMNPLVAKLLRGETLPQPQRNTRMDLDRILNSAKGPEYYREQIQICVANPGRFLASWQLLVTLFGEAKLYDFIHHCAWTEAELKPFIIQEDEEEDD